MSLAELLSLNYDLVKRRLISLVSRGGTPLQMFATMPSQATHTF